MARTRKQIMEKVRKALVLPTDDAQQKTFERVLGERRATIQRLEADYAELKGLTNHYASELNRLREERDAPVAAAPESEVPSLNAVIAELRSQLAETRLDYLTLASRAVSNRIVYRED